VGVGILGRIDYEYYRNGTANLFALLDLHRPGGTSRSQTSGPLALFQSPDYFGSQGFARRAALRSRAPSYAAFRCHWSSRDMTLLPASIFTQLQPHPRGQKVAVMGTTPN
jgi:hypothetical protein